MLWSQNANHSAERSARTFYDGTKRSRLRGLLLQLGRFTDFHSSAVVCVMPLWRDFVGADQRGILRLTCFLRPKLHDQATASVAAKIKSLHQANE
jgi:hypothetical protein